MNEICYWYICFIPVSISPVTKIFGFSEFLAAIALLAVLYTITDVRYKFRIAITPGSLYVTTFGLIAVIGLQTLLSEIWIAEGWWVPKTIGLTRSTWQGIFGLLFLGTFLTWMYYAFILPPVFCRRNARRFAQELYRYILRGNDDELKVIANELARSAEPLIRYTKLILPHYNNNEASKKHAKKKESAEDYAHDILLLIANRKFCQQIVAASPVTAQAFFEEMTNTNKYHIPIGQFARNIFSEAVVQKGSFLYGEAEGYESGLLGYLKPVSQAVFGDHKAITTISPSPLDIHYEEKLAWDAKQWEAYCRAILIALKNFLSEDHDWDDSHALNRAIDNIEDAFRDLSTLSDAPNAYNSDVYARLRVAADFIKDVIELIDKQANPPKPLARVHEHTYPKNLYDHLALLIFNMCFVASTVKLPPDTCWSIYYGVIWSHTYKGYSNGPAWRIVRFKVRRLLYDEIVRLSEFPNYKGSRILGYCLNILGMQTRTSSKSNERDEYALAKVVQSWTKKNYLTMRQANPEVADSVLIGRLSFDEAENRLVITYFKGLSRETPKDYLELELPKS